MEKIKCWSYVIHALKIRSYCKVVVQQYSNEYSGSNVQDTVV